MWMSDLVCCSCFITFGYFCYFNCALAVPTWARLLIYFLSVIDITTSNTFQLGVFFRLHCLVHRPTVTVKKPSPLYDCLQSELIEMKKHLDLSASLFFSLLFSSLLFSSPPVHVFCSLQFHEE